jgi:crotonobetainyl-CoA:carnitine CoA-transferase CaiB-like acyl-CoA transferase
MDCRANRIFMTRTDDAREKREGPLDGIRVLECAVFHAGPGGSAILGDLGAEVIKIETPSGDPERHWTNAGGIDFSLGNEDSAMFEASNRNKRGICIDLKKQKGREIFDRLAKQADVFVTNLRKSTKIRMGIDYGTLSRLNPRIIHASVSGYGLDGPMSDIGAFDPLGQARSGMMFVTGSSQPAMLHIGLLDQATAITLSHAILTALFVRERKGIGQEVHVSLYSTALWIQYANLMLCNLLSTDPCVPANRFDHSPLRNAFSCQDGEWILGTHHPEEKYWPSFCEATEQTALLDDPHFTDDSGKPVNYPRLVELFDEVFATKPRDEWMEIFRKRGLMFCSVQHILEVPGDPQALANDYVVPFDHPVLGSIQIPGYPVHFSACKAGTRSAAPRLGEHTDQILRELGYADPDIDTLRAEGVIL